MDYFGKLDYVQSWEKYETRSYVTKLNAEGNEAKDWVFKTKRRTVGKWRVTGAQPSIMVRRVIPRSRCPDVGVVEVDDNLANIEHLQWIMTRYPLEIMAKEKWESKLVETQQLISRRSQMDKLEYASPAPEFKGELRDFQKLGLDFLLKNKGVALLADEMGLGKTIMALAWIASQEHSLPALVAAPLVTLWNWKNEIERFLGNRSVTILRDGNPGDLPTSDFYILNYELLSKRKDDLIRIGIRTIIADEVQALRN